MTRAPGDPPPSGAAAFDETAHATDGATALAETSQAAAADALGETVDSSRPAAIPSNPRDPVGAGSRIGRYVIEHRLGGGAMGVVYAARDPGLDRRVAIKVIKASLRYPDLQDRLRREAQSLARIAHPNVVVVHEVGDHGGEIFIAMELVVGCTLREWLERPRTRVEILDAFRQAGAGLSAAHAAGLVHRDFKPDNVLVGDDGRVRVTDFGLARIDDGSIDVPTAMAAVALPASTTPRATSQPALTASAPSPLQLELTATGAMLGTPRYAAPEQLTADNPTAASDQFSFCVALYETLYGQHPFGGATLVELIERTTGGMIAAPPANTEVSPAIERALRRGLSSQPADRFPSMNALLAALAPLPATRRPGLVVGAAALGVAAIAVTALVATRHRAGSGCTLDANAVAATWSAQARKQVGDYVGSGAEAKSPRGRLRDSILSRYDTYAAALTTAMQRVCGAEGAGDRGAAPRAKCLAKRLGAFEQTWKRTLTLPPQATWSNAGLLLSVSACDAATATDAGELSQKLQTTVLQMTIDIDATKYAELVEREETVLRAFPQPGLAPVRSAAMIQIATGAGFAGHPDDAVHWLERAMLEAGDDRSLRVQAATLLATRQASRGNLEAARAALETVARAGIELDLAAEAHVAYVRGKLAMADGKTEEAITQWETAQALFAEIEQLDGDVLFPLEQAYRKVGRVADAERISEHLRSVFAGRDGTLLTTAKACVDSFGAGKLAEAMTPCRQAAEIAQAAPKLEAFAIAPLSTIANILELVHDDLAASEAAYQRAAALGHKYDLAAQAQNLESAARVELELGDATSAVRDYRESAAIATTLGAAGEAQVAYARYGLGRALVANGEYEAGRVELQWALPRLEGSANAARITLASARIALAEALWRRAQDNDRARAKLLALTAQDDIKAHLAGLRGSGPFEVYFVPIAERVAQRVTAWIASHR